MSCEFVIISEETASTVVIENGTGPQGIQGINGGDEVEVLAGEAIPMRACVYCVLGRAYVLRSDDLAHCTTMLGIASSAARQGDTFKVQVAGEHLIPGNVGGVPPGPLYVGFDGRMSHVPPTSGFLLQCGTAHSTEMLIIRLEPPVILEN